MLAAVIVGILLLFVVVGGVAFMLGGARALWLNAKTSKASAAAFWFFVVSMAFFLSVVLFLAGIE